MSSSSILAELLSARLERAEIALPDEHQRQIVVFLELLARWNRKVNLTAFDLERPTTEAIDRLVIEPVRAALHVRATDRTALDIGSGGGSPAIPLLVCCPQLMMVLVESREKKGAFLREAVRSVGVAGAVEVCRIEEYSERQESAGSVDVISMRAVRADRGIWAGVDRLLAPAGMMLWFRRIGLMTDIVLITAILRRIGGWS